MGRTTTSVRFGPAFLLAMQFGLYGTMASAQTPISECGSIRESGAYQLVNNLRASGDCLVVAADAAADITIDLNGFTIRGDGTGSGIRGDKPFDGFTVRNGTVRNFNIGLSLFGNTFVLENMRLIRNTLRYCSVIDYPGATDTAIGSINANGDFVGEYIIGGGVHGFINVANQFRPVDYPNGTNTLPYALNSADDMVGQYKVPDTTAHGFKLMGDTFESIDVPGAPNTRPRGIDDSNTISGDYCDVTSLTTCNFQAMTSGHRHGFQLNNGSFASIDVPDATYTETWGRSMGTGQTLGRYRDADGHSHLYVMDQSGTFFTIDFPGAVETAYGNFTDAGGINNAGDIVSTYCSAGPCPMTSADVDQSPGVTHGGLLTHAGRFYTVDYPEAAATELFGLNDYRQIVGAIHSADGHFHGLLCQK
jgi:hypothetical protein